MLLKSNSSIAPRSEASSAAFARPKRYVRRRSGLTRSSQSTVIAPGEANVTSGPSGVAETVDDRYGVHQCYTADVPGPSDQQVTLGIILLLALGTDAWSRRQG